MDLPIQLGEGKLLTGEPTIAGMVAICVDSRCVADQQHPLPDVELSTCELPLIQQVWIGDVLLNHLILIFLPILVVNSFVIFS